MDACYSFSLERLRCCFTTRALGSFTFARAMQEDILNNYHQLEEAAGVKPERIVRPWLANGTKVARVGEEDAGLGVTRPVGRLDGVDAIYTCTSGLYISITTADCFALVLYDRVRRVLGIAHCGWRGIVNRLDQSLLQAMNADFGCKAEDVLAVIGPGIRGCCYRQNDDGLRAAFANYKIPDLIRENGDGTYDIDIGLSLKANLREMGIASVVDTRNCTGCESQFFSARLEGFETGRMLNLAAMI